MRFFILTIGKTKMAGLRDSLAHYQECIRHFTEIEYLELKDAGSDPDKEGKAMLAALEKRALLQSGKHKIILLDVGGKSISSEQLAKNFTRAQDAGTQTMIFLIGGAYGFADSFCQELGNCERLSLSPMTFTHELARVILLEQIYRALHIQSGSKYHHS